MTFAYQSSKCETCMERELHNLTGNRDRAPDSLCMPPEFLYDFQALAGRPISTQPFMPAGQNKSAWLGIRRQAFTCVAG